MRKATVNRAVIEGAILTDSTPESGLRIHTDILWDTSKNNCVVTSYYPEYGVVFNVAMVAKKKTLCIGRIHG